MKKTISLIAGAILCGGILLTGCGGGDNSSENIGNSSGGNNNNLLFPKNAVLAKPSLENGKKVADIVLSVPDVGIPRLFMDLVNNMAINDNLPNKDSTKCIDDIGTLSYEIKEKNENYINVIFTANNCNFEDEIINGRVNLIAENFDNNVNKYKKYTAKYSTEFNWKILYNNTEVNISANSYIEENVDFDKDSNLNFDEDSNLDFGENGILKEDNLSISLKATNGTKDVGLENSKFHFIKKDDSSIEFYQSKGRIYIDKNSYVDYNKTVKPFKYSIDAYTLIDGEAHYNMADNSKMRIVVLGSDNVKVEIDTDGDGEFELNESININE